ncbi:MAG: hypothetical protein IPM66_17000 [Acidobacteriota bacterium]|nr:MAG: hypothetical protein IPM66_17000 [Acidobacteriota bacterium]
MELSNARKRLEDALAEYYGWSAHPLLREKVAAAVASKAGRLKIEPDEYCGIAAGNLSELLALVEEVTASETFFFREPEQYRFLRLEILKELMWDCPEGEKLRLWSAACSTGEEAYSLAIAFDQARFEGGPVQVDIFATDVRNRALLKASQANYSTSALRELDAPTRDRYFEFSETPEPLYTVIPEMRRCITFRRVNLFDRLLWKSLSGKFDLIVCANQLMYMNNTAARQLVGNLVNSLRVGGYLMVSPAEISLVSSSHFVQLISAPSFFRRIG